LRIARQMADAQDLVEYDRDYSSLRHPKPTDGTNETAM
jgi:hypothetical protein